MSDPDDNQKQIDMLRGELRIVSGAISASEGRLKRYQEDYEKYESALETLDKVQKETINGKEFINKGKSALHNYASGNKEGEADGAMSAVGSIFSSTASGIGAIITIIEKDMELLNEKYMEEFKTYEGRINDYNNIVRKIIELGGTAGYKSQTITKGRLG